VVDEDVDGDPAAAESGADGGTGAGASVGDMCVVDVLVDIGSFGASAPSRLDPAEVGSSVFVGLTAPGWAVEESSSPGSSVELLCCLDSSRSLTV
jgi:hypothetical protein